MRILIVNTQVPFVHGGAEFLADNLLKSLKKHGHSVEQVKIPFKWYPPQKILDQILAVRLMDLTESCAEPIDLIIALKFPAYFVKHPNKVVWLLHQHRQAYELWNTEFSDLSALKDGEALRESIMKADNSFLPEAKKIFTLSKNVSNRLKTFNKIESTPLYHPPPDFDQIVSGDYENYLFMPSRLEEMKRQYLAIKAMKFVKSSVKLIIAGQYDSLSYEKSLKDLVKANSLDSKVQFLGPISQKEKIKLYSNCLATIFIPYQEDYGYITLEAFYAKKAVITCSDSGCPLEFVKDKQTGLVSEPTPKSIAKAIDFLAGKKQRAMDMGSQAFDLVQQLELSWEKVVEALTT